MKTATMKQKIQLAMKSLNPNSPQPTATMMKFHDGKLAAFGGTFCIQIPCGIDVDCAFNPATLLDFFRKDRKGVSYTVNDKGRMVVKQGRERVTIPVLPSSEMPILDVVRKTVEVKKFPKKKALRSMLECVDPASDAICLQGMLLHNGLIVATDRRVMLAMVSGLPKKLHCVLPTDTIKFLASLDESPVEVTADVNAVKFIFADGMSVTSQVICPDDYPDYKKILAGEKDCEELTMHKDLLSEIAGLKSETISLSHSGVSYKDGKSFGEIDLKTKDKFAFDVDREKFELMLTLTTKNKVKVNHGLIHAEGGKFFKMVLCTIRTN